MPEGIPDYPYSLLSERALNDELHVHKLRVALDNPAFGQLINDFPIIPELFLEALSVPNIHELVTEKFIWEYWSKTLVEEQEDAPDVTQIADLVQVSEASGRKIWPPAPYESTQQLSDAVQYA
jgi:hypothetical protein